MPSVTLEEARARLPELIAQLSPAEDLFITKDGRPVARLVRMAAPPTGRRRAGTMIGKLRIVKEDEEHLGDFKEYVP
jgi:antitoxin (DNA-binding transcriptional repressor) of toxin-antitoxin stability system